MSGKHLEIKGQVERITYYNEENGYTIARMKVQGRVGVVSVVGTMHSINPGEILKLVGFWDNHEKYGEQFKVVSYEQVMPATAKGIEKYLGSGMIKGIGPVTAKRLVARFGKETLDVIEHDIERLYEVPGIGEKRIEMIKSAWELQKEIKDVMVFLQGHGISPTYAMKIYRQYGKDSVKVVKENPFRLAMDIFGIGFITADKIAEKLGVPKDSRIRAEAGIVYVLHELSDEGNVFYPYTPLIERCREILDIDEENIRNALNGIASEGKVVIEEASSYPYPPTEEKAVYLKKFHVSETGIARQLYSILSYPKQLRLVNVERALEWVQRSLGMVLSEKQMEAVKDSINCKVMVITGGPGTGKTTIIKAIIKIYERMGQKVVLTAPTGRAAKRMAETTGCEAKTVHRLLEYNPTEVSKESSGFKRNESNPIEGDLIIVDEASMMETILTYHFLKAVPKKATLIFVGDVDQLPSVGAGNVLKDIIESGVIPTVRLKEIFRQSRESMIILNAHRINNGEMPLFGKRGAEATDFYFIQVESPEEALDRLVYLCREGIPRRFGYDPLEDIQVLSPMYKGVVGVANLNSELQRILNRNTDEIARGGKRFKRGDKVLQLRNNYDKDVYNGDIGRIVEIDRELQEIRVDFDGRIVPYDFEELDELVLAYAISVHKSQGSEYPVVIMPVMTQHFMLLQRNLIYTGITRGKRLVVLIGTKKALAIAVKNNKTQLRYTLLRSRLIKEQARFSRST
ncbi:MAG: ATP-dependent RecD-like DNA helicase [Syntrophorhabdaceae bacterium]|nr:ATP-dependent RecD-like DNA helicase [Syntrophorhabdaceae bacterium]